MEEVFWHEYCAYRTWCKKETDAEFLYSVSGDIEQKRTVCHRNHRTVDRRSDQSEHSQVPGGSSGRGTADRRADRAQPDGSGYFPAGSADAQIPWAGCEQCGEAVWYAQHSPGHQPGNGGTVD